MRHRSRQIALVIGAVTMILVTGAPSSQATGTVGPNATPARVATSTAATASAARTSTPAATPSPAPTPKPKRHPTVTSPGPLPPGAARPGVKPSPAPSRLQRALVASGTSAPASALPVSPCTLSGTTRTCELWATTGELTFPESPPLVLTVWGFSTSSTPGTARVPAPVLIANAGEAVQIVIHNELPAPEPGADNRLSIEMPASGATPDIQGVNPGGQRTYRFGSLSPGTYLYEAGPTSFGARQVKMGLAGILVVRPANFASCNCAYGNAAADGFVDEATLLLNEFDPAFNEDPFGADPVDFSPTEFTINGLAYNPLNPTAGKINVAAGDVLLLRYANLSDHERGITIANERQTILADDSYVLTNPGDVATKWLNPGQVSDSFVTIDPSFVLNTHVPVYDAGFHFNNGPATGLGGMFTYLDVVQPLSGSASGPVTTVTVAAATNSGIEDVTVSGTITASPGTVLTDAEWFLDDPGVPGTAPKNPTLPLVSQHIAVSGASTPYSFTIPSTALNMMLLSSINRDGDHIVWVHAKDSSGGAGTGITITPTTLTNPSMNWNTNQWVGASVSIGADTLVVTSNTATTLTGTAGWSPATPTAYTLVLSEAGPGSAGPTTLTDATQTWVANQWVGAAVSMGGDALVVASNTAGVLTGVAPWTPAVPVDGPYTLSISGSGSGIGATTLTDTTQAWVANQWVGAIVSLDGSTLVVTSNTATTLTGAAGWTPATPTLAYILSGGSWGVVSGDVFTYDATGPVIAGLSTHVSPTNGNRPTDVANGGGAPVNGVPQNAPSNDLVILGMAGASLSNFVVTGAEYCIDATTTCGPVSLVLTPTGSNAVFDPTGNLISGGPIDAYGNPLITPTACVPVPSPPGISPPAIQPAPGGGSVVSFCGIVPASVLKSPSLAEGAHTLHIHACEQVQTSTTACASQVPARWGPFNTDADIKFVIDRTGPTASTISIDPNPNNGHESSSGNLNFLASIQVQATLSDPVVSGVNSNIAYGEVFVSCSPVTQAACRSVNGPIDPVTNAPPPDGTGAEMIASGAAWNSPTKVAFAYIPLAELTAYPEGRVRFWVHAQDQAGNFGRWTYEELIYDRTAPVFDSPPLAVPPAQPDSIPCSNGCTIIFTAHDPMSGGVNSNIVQAEWFVDQGAHLICEPSFPGCTPEVLALSDPGYGNGTSVPITTTLGPSLAGNIVLGPQSPGTQIVFRVKDAAGNWSLDNLVVTG